jgi:nucleotide sugar dehydrogenase
MLNDLDSLDNFLDKKDNPRIGVIGAGRLGICFALLVDEAGYDVVVSDVRDSYVKGLNERVISTNEPLVADLLKKSNIKATTDNEEVIKECDIIYTFVSTPSTKDGDYDVSAVDSVVSDFNTTAWSTTGPNGSPVCGKTFVVGCTTNPGDCERWAKKLKDTDVSVFYNPEFIAQGSIIKGLREADMVLVGGDYDAHVEHNSIFQIYEAIQITPLSYHSMSLTAAELVKMALNCYLTMKISYANQVGEVMSRFGLGREIDTVLDAIGADSRVGSKYLGYGFGFGGPCLPRDNRAFAHAAKRVGLKNNIGLTMDAFNDEHSDFLADYLCEKNPNKKKPFYFKEGITYKKGTNILEESQQYKLFKELMSRGYKCIAWELPEVVEMVYNDLLYTWPGQFQFIYGEEQVPKDAFVI